ncbi:MAG: repeat containing protein [Cyanobacteria bacterium RYN_339]|nr:repeat containing protein [Cyanobacteria bacterium RYN_339]
MRLARWHSLSLAALVLASCKTTAPPVVRPSTRPPTLLAASPTPRPVASTAPTLPPPAPTASPAAVVNYALAGVVQLPATVVANNSAGLLTASGIGLVANNGSGVVANNGSSYALLALAQQGLTGALVKLQGADGKPILGADGQPLTTRTDATGHYGFPAAPAGQAVVSVTLPGALGSLQAIAPRGEHRTANLELVSSLTTAYILDRYVKGQADPVAVLAKLPDQVEATTRTRADAAIAAGNFTPPATLATDQLVAAVDQLRGRDRAFDGQLETVKALLVVAGQVDLGNGQPALTVALNGIRTMAQASDGALYFESLASDDKDHTNVPSTRLWRLGADGKLAAVAGNGQTILTGGASAADGATALEVACHGGIALGVDKGGRPLFVSDLDKAYRVKADGKLELLYDAKMGFPVVTWVGGDATAEAVVLGEQNALLVVDAPGKTHKLATLAAIAAGTHAFGRDATGRFYAANGKRVVRLDPATGGQELISSTAAGVALAPSGHVLELGANGSLSLIAPDGTRSVVLAKAPADFKLDLDACAVAADDTIHLAQGGTRIFRLRAQVLEAVAGLPAGGSTGGTALQLPTSFDVGPDGGLVVADDAAHQVLRIGADGATTVVAGTGAAGADGGDGGPGKLATFGTLHKVRLGPDGAIWVLESSGTQSWLRRIGTDGVIQDLWDATGVPNPTMAIAKDGRILVASGAHLWQRVGEGAFVRSDGLDAGLDLPVLDVEADPRGGFQVMVGAFGNASVKGYHYEGSGLANALGSYSDNPAAVQGGLDPTGRYFFPRLDPGAFVTQVVRFDAAAGALVPVAGQGGTVLNGNGADNFLSDPVDVRFDAAGNMYVLDKGARQVKKVPATALR